MDFYDQIYYSLIGELEEEAALPWVDNAFAPGSVCEAAYSRLISARNRLLSRLDSNDDPDLSQMLDEMNKIQHILCRYILSMRLQDDFADG